MMQCHKVLIQSDILTLSLFSISNEAALPSLSFKRNDIEVSLYESEFDAGIIYDQESIYPIRLFENKQYFFQIDYKTEWILEESVFFRPVKNAGNKKYLFVFESKNYVGVLNLVSFGLNVPVIEVCSKKIDYRYEYNLLLRKISELGIDLLTRSSSLFEVPASLSQRIISDENILNSKIAYLRCFILGGELEILYNAFFRKPHSRMRENRERKFIWELDAVDLTSFESIAYESSYSHGNIVYPLTAESRVFEDSLDTVENKFLRYLLEFLIRFIEDIRNFLNSQNGNSNNLLFELDQCLRICEGLLSFPLFKNISKLTYFPGKSNVLQNRFPYKQLFYFYWFLSSSIELSDVAVDDSIRLPQKDLPKLYEYWCFLHLLDLLNSRYPSIDVIMDNLVRYEPSSLCYVINPRSAKIHVKLANDKTLYLFYNKSYAINKFIFGGRSYSHTLTPDISFELFKRDKLIAILHFDAKYKLEGMQRFKEEDIDKMHTYKDGILGTIGAFVLYPGETSDIFKQAEKDEDVEEVTFPAVGAFHFNIEEKAAGSERRSLLEIIDKFVHIDSELSVTAGFESTGRDMHYLKRLLD